MFRLQQDKRGESKTRLYRAAVSSAAAFLIASVIFLPVEPAFAQSTTDSSASGSSDSSSNNIAPSSAGTPAADSSPATSPDNTPTDQTTASPPATPGSVAPQTSASTDQSSNSNALTPATAPPANGNTNGGSNSGANPKPPTGALFTQGAGSPGPGSVATDFFNQSQFKIDQNTGAARITYPIAIPPGRNNLQPDVNLSYDSQNAQLGGIFGEGWSIDIPYIQRLNKNGVDKLYSSSTPSYFMSTFDGELSTTTVATACGITRMTTLAISRAASIPRTRP